jgi:hypothetical protein
MENSAMTNNHPPPYAVDVSDAAKGPTGLAADVPAQADEKRPEKKTYSVSQEVAEQWTTIEHYLRHFGVYRLFVDASAGESAQEVHLALVRIEHWLAECGLPYCMSLFDDQQIGGTDPDLVHPATVFPAEWTPQDEGQDHRRCILACVYSAKRWLGEPPCESDVREAADQLTMLQRLPKTIERFLQHLRWYDIDQRGKELDPSKAIRFLRGCLQEVESWLLSTGVRVPDERD